MESLTINALSKRETQVFQQLLTGKSQQDIADALYICVRTVKFHCGNIYEKLAVKNKTELLKIFHQTNRNTGPKTIPWSRYK